MDQAFDTGFDLNECTIGHQIDHLTGNQTAFGIFGNDIVPGIAGLLLEAEGNAFFVFVDTDDNDFDLLSDSENFARMVVFDLGAVLAGSDMVFAPENVALLEGWIDEMQGELEELTAFILPGGSREVSLCHVCRCVCRRLERNMVVWSEESGETVAESVWQFVNRLSDYCFVLSRFVAKNLEIRVYFWEK